MEVAHRNDFISHAVIGGGPTIEFGISSSAEFFNILSSTLYKDQILAVVREVLCNAWDAHIEAGIMDRPVEITLTQEKFVIRDYGNGIHKDDMGHIYGTYGNSTKKNDGNQTGGFGLGCKAPFAYIDHFEVQSTNDGIRTIYNLSKSSASAHGKPGIIPIASFPSAESGLQVTISIKNRTDYNRFVQLVNRIASNGDMNMLLNGKRIEPMGFDVAKANYMMIMDASLLDNKSSIMIRYGNVVYPVDKVDALSTEYHRITSHMEKLKQYNSYSIIFQAPPHSISVTPSRESLSMQDHTVNTLRKIFQDFIAVLDADFVKACESIAEQTIDEAVSAVDVPALLQREEMLPWKNIAHNVPDMINDLAVMAKRFMDKNYPKTMEFRKRDLGMRVKKMAVGGLLDRGLAQTWLKAMDEVQSVDSNRWGYERNTWLQRRVIAPLVTKMQAAGIEVDKLFAYDAENINVDTKYGKVAPLMEATKVASKHHFKTLPYLRNIVVIATSRTDVKDRAKRHPVMKELGDFDGFFFYQASMGKVKREAALKFFNESGMAVIDLTVRQEWEGSSIRAALPVVRKPVKKGLVSMMSIRKGTTIDTRSSREEDADRVIDPEFVILTPVRADLRHNTLEKWDRLATQYILDLFGSKGGVVTNSLMHAKWIEKGAKDFEVYLVEKLCEYMTTNPRIQEFEAFNPERAQKDFRFASDLADLVEVVYDTPLLRAEFGLVNNLTEEDKKYIFLWKEYTSRFHYSWPDTAAKVRSHLLSIPVDPANSTLLKKFIGNKLLPMIDSAGLSKILRTEDPASPLVKSAITILTTAINN